MVAKKTSVSIVSSSGGGPDDRAIGMVIATGIIGLACAVDGVLCVRTLSELDGADGFVAYSH